ncbi:MAG: tektin family protein, partial [Treponema sp.]|nr:tektin family protein [Treponema sp.]
MEKTTKNAHQTKGLKPVEKPTKKTPKKITLDDLLKSQEDAWKAIRETEESFKKFQEETQKAHKETEKAHKETEKAIKETQKNIGGLNNTLGSIVERLLIPGLPKKFKKFGYSFNRLASYSYTDGVYAQIDGMLE